jgi:protein-S-isoprenylcysteine O-methyltransferase Ste14
MSLRTEFEKSGSWLFRHRSFLPVGAVPVIAVSLFSYHHQGLSELGQLTGLLISLVGLSVRMLTIGYAPEGTSGRNTTSQVADELNTTGMYSMVRHPLYLGNFLIVFGLILALHNWAALLLAICIFCLFYERIMFAEEAFLRQQFAAQFESWARKTPAFFPHLTGWVRPPVSFCWRTVLRREYTGVFLITTLFFLLDFVGDSIAEGHLKIDWKWTTVFVFGLLAYLALWLLKKYTRILHVKGR